MIYNTSKEHINDIKQRVVDRWILGAIDNEEFEICLSFGEIK